MKYKGKEIKKYLMENITHGNTKHAYIPPRRFTSIKYPDDRLYLGELSISLAELKEMYGPDASEVVLVEKGKKYLVQSALDRYTVTQRAEPGVKAMLCKVNFMDVNVGGAFLKDCDIFVPVFTTVAIPRHSVIYTSDKNDPLCKRRASAGKITNILWTPAYKTVGCLLVPKNPDRPIGCNFESIKATIIYNSMDDEQLFLECRTGSRYGMPLDNCFVRVKIDDYNPKTKATNTVYSIYEIEQYVNHMCRGWGDVIDYQPFARHIGYSVKIDDFDITPTTCSTGFHFFDSVDAAQNYICYS